MGEYTWIVNKHAVAVEVPDTWMLSEYSDADRDSDQIPDVHPLLDIVAARAGKDSQATRLLTIKPVDRQATGIQRDSGVRVRVRIDFYGDNAISMVPIDMDTAVMWIPVIVIAHRDGFEPLRPASIEPHERQVTWDVAVEHDRSLIQLALILVSQPTRNTLSSSNFGQVFRVVEQLTDDLTDAKLHSYGQPLDTASKRLWGTPHTAPDPQIKIGSSAIDSDSVPFEVRSNGSSAVRDWNAANVRGLGPSAINTAGGDPLGVNPLPRHLVGRMTNQARVGQRIPLTVWVDVASGSGSSVPLNNFTSTDGGTVTLDLFCPRFRVLSESTQTVAMEPGQPSSPARFEIEATTPGNHQIEVSAWRASVYLGTLALDISVSTQDVRSVEPTERVATLASRKAQPGEVTLDLQYNPETKRYRFQLRGEALGIYPPMEAEPLQEGGRQTKLSQFVALMNSQARGLTRYDAAQTRQWLEGMGALLWKELLPEPLKALLWDNLGSIKRFNIISPGDPMPWEMLFPFKEGSPTPGFLTELTTVTRWIYGSPPPAVLGQGPLCCVLPDGAPSSAQKEIDELQRIWGRGETVNEMSGLLQRLKGADFGLMHFATHNISPDNSLISASIPMGGQEFTPMFIGPHYTRAFAKRAPLVFINACESNTMAPAYTQLSGWANCFLEAGAGAFIGSLWEIRDTSAVQFSGAVHATLKQGKTLGEAMQAGREAIGGMNGDPTWLAYTLYGDPDAVMAG